MKIGIFFGGPSREREISFAGGRTVYDNLNKSLFEPVPIFVDSQCNFILLNWEYVYKGTIRDFYPPVQFHPKSAYQFQLYLESLGELADHEMEGIIEAVGQKIEPNEFKDYFDFAFLALHGYFGEDGIIQGLLESISMPYSGSGIRASSIGIDKGIQKSLMTFADFPSPKMCVIQRSQWEGREQEWYEKAQKTIQFPLVVRPAHQGSSIGVSILQEGSFETFVDSVDKAFFIKKINATQWNSYSEEEKVEFIKELTDLRDGVGLPVRFNDQFVVYHPDDLMLRLNETAKLGENIVLYALNSEQKAVIESFIVGREFSTIVIRKEDGGVLAFPPTEIVKFEDLYDYRSKYLPGLSRKVTPIDLPDEAIQEIRSECERLFHYLDFQTYARIDGFYGADGKVYLNDPNTTSGMLPSSFFFHQAAEIGMNPSEFLTYIIRISLMERMNHSLVYKKHDRLLDELDEAIELLHSGQKNKINVGVILGGYSFERHISVESGRNIFEKLSSSEKYNPIPIFLYKNDVEDELYQIPISLLLKDNADDIFDKITHFSEHPITKSIKKEHADIIGKYVDVNTVFEPKKITFEALASEVDICFIALHGRPGEDGTLQQKLKAQGIPYNGSDWESSHVTIDKYKTLQTLKEHGFAVADQLLLNRDEYISGDEAMMDKIEANFAYPLIAKPVDDGCSSAVKKVNNRTYLKEYLKGIFRAEDELTLDQYDALGLSRNEEFPQKKQVLIESLISPNGASKFMEITCGLLTHIRNGEIVYEVFEPSEALATGEVLSLEEKFLAGEGQNITPARFSLDQKEYLHIAGQVKRDLEKASRILKVKGYARIDAFVRIDEQLNAETIVIEVNSLPGMTPATCIFHQCALHNYKPYQFIDKILDFAFEEKKTM